MSDLRNRGTPAQANNVINHKPMASEREETSETEYSEWDPAAKERKRKAKEQDRQKVKTSERNANTTILEADKGWQSKKASFLVRFMWTWPMVGGFILLIAMGHVYTMFLVMILTVSMFYEIITLKRNVEKDKKIPLFRVLRWFLFFVFTIYMMRRLVGQSHLDPMWKRVSKRHNLPMLYEVLVVNQMFGIYLLFLVGVIGFVLSLRKFTLRYQFHQLGWTLLCLVLIVGQAMMHIFNIYSGMVWFAMSTLLVIANDIFAYMWGFTIGRTPLIALSPKKTWEGFIGGGLTTMFMAMVFMDMFMDDFWLCPQPDFANKPFEPWTKLKCDSSIKENFTKVIYQIKVPFTPLTFDLTTLRVHALVLGTFASLFAPFGGFFASGFKRAFRIKDFGDVIPGHGGVTDRFDCQVIMGGFTYMYLNTFVYGNFVIATLAAVKNQADSLSSGERAELIKYLQNSP